MNKKILIGIIIVVVILAALFWPKPCDRRDWAWAGGAGTECDCMGLKIGTSSPACMDCPATTACLGIVISQRDVGPPTIS